MVYFDRKRVKRELENAAHALINVKLEIATGPDCPFVDEEIKRALDKTLGIIEQLSTDLCHDYIFDEL